MLVSEKVTLEFEVSAIRNEASWGRVLEEWVRPWFGVRDLYRPVVSLSFGVNWALSPSPFGFHLLNALLLAGTATAVAVEVKRDTGVVVVPFGRPVPTRTIGVVWRASSPRADVINRLADLVPTPT